MQRPGLVEFTLENGKRPDFINLQSRLVLELKPNNPRAISLGNKQAQGYADEINNFGGLPGVASGPGTQPFTTEVITYTIK